MCWSLFPLTALAPAQVWARSYVHGSGALTTRGASWSGDGVAMAACDESAASGVALPTGVAPPPTGDAPPPAGDTPTPAGVALPPVVAPSVANCDGWVKTGGGCVNCDAASSSTCCGVLSMVARMSSTRISSQASWSSTPVSKAAGWTWNWNRGRGTSARSLSPSTNRATGRSPAACSLKKY
jgi:hypothetical protein